MGVTSFVVDRSRWIRGSINLQNGLSGLLKSNGCMCFLGFLAVACGAHAADILDQGDPCDARHVAWPEGLLDEDGDCTVTTEHLVKINDDDDITDDVRESRLTTECDDLGITVTFVDSMEGT